MRHITTSLHDVLRLDLECSRVVDLLEITSEVALVVVLPLDQSRDLIGEFRVGNVAPSLVHGALVTAFQSWRFLVVPETAALVAGLVVDFAAHNIEDQGVTRDLLIGLDLDDVTSLDTAPVCDLEALVPL